MCVFEHRIETTPAAPPAEEVKEKNPDIEISAKKSRDKKRGTSTRNTGLNRFLIVPNAVESGINIPE